MRIAITGLGVVSPVGVGVPAFFDALASGASAIRAVDPQSARPAPEAPRCALLARVGEFGARQQISPGALRRMPRLSQMTLVAAKEALLSSGAAYDSTRTGMVLGTGLGTLGETLEFVSGYVDEGVEAASPATFPVSVMNAPAGQVALELKLRGLNSTVNHRDLSPLAALTMACDQLALGRADAIIAGAMDEISPPVLHAFARLGPPSATGLRPYDVTRDGLVLGEAAVMVVLEREEDARRRGADIWALVTGRGESGDHRPRVGWGHAAEWPEAARAVRQALNGIDPERVGWVAGGGNGTNLDERELRTLAAGLGRLPPTSSILGQTGESLSSAMLRVAAALYVLRRGTLPGTTGLEQAPPEFAHALVRQGRAARVGAALVASFAQGGGNAAVVLSQPTSPS